MIEKFDKTNIKSGNLKKSRLWDQLYPKNMRDKKFEKPNIKSGNLKKSRLWNL